MTASSLFSSTRFNSSHLASLFSFVLNLADLLVMRSSSGGITVSVPYTNTKGVSLVVILCVVL